MPPRKIQVPFKIKLSAPKRFCSCLAVRQMEAIVFGNQVELFISSANVQFTKRYSDERRFVTLLGCRSTEVSAPVLPYSNLSLYKIRVGINFAITWCEEKSSIIISMKSYVSIRQFKEMYWLRIGRYVWYNETLLLNRTHRHKTCRKLQVW